MSSVPDPHSERASRGLRALVVEDDPLQLEIETRWLQEHGHVVHGCGRGSLALSAIARESFDVVVLDRMLPDMPGEDVLRHIRGSDTRVPVIMATAMGDDHEIAAMLDLGADDYAVKPLRRLEFVARIEAAARRAGLLDDPHSSPIELGPYRIDFAGRGVWLHGSPVRMTPRMVDLAMLLFRKRGEVVSRADIFERVWGRGSADADTRTVDTHACRVRRALELDGRHGAHLVGVYQRGYRLDLV